MSLTCLMSFAICKPSYQQKRGWIIIFHLPEIHTPWATKSIILDG